MSQEIVVNLDFWSKPPWSDGKGKYRLGLKPIQIEDWFDVSIDEELRKHKEDLLNNSYETVVRATNCSLEAQELILYRPISATRLYLAWCRIAV